jgi:plastocyanin
LVHRQLAPLSSFASLVALIAALLLPAAADASNRQIAISNYRWSDPEIQVDLGEHVTWNWIGPDTMHSVTGTSANDLQWDSDPQTNQPRHKLGDDYRVTFDQPGVYTFHCKLHSTVKGEVVVSSTPGDPVSEPDPVPKSQVDLKAPHLRDLRLKKPSFTKAGTALRYSLNEPSKIDVDYYRYDSNGRRKFDGWSSFKGHVGYNDNRFAAKAKHFRPRPGSYVAVVRATDDANNASRPQRVKFTIG